MADQYTDTNETVYTDTDDTTYAGTRDDTAFPNHGVDGNNNHDAAKGAGLGAIGGAVVGGIAGGPVGAIIGAIAGGAASGVGVAAVDKVDNDNSFNERTTSDSYIGGTDPALRSGSVYNNIEDGGSVYSTDTDDTLVGESIDDGGVTYGNRAATGSVYDETTSVR